MTQTQWTPGNVVARLEEARNEALRLYAAGATFRTIAAQQDVTVATAWRRVQKAIDEMRPHADFDRYRAEQMIDISLIRRQCRQTIVMWSNDDWRTKHAVTLADVHQAMLRLMQLLERESKLLGLDRAPHPMDDLTGISDAELEAWMVDMVQSGSIDATARDVTA